MAAGMGSRYGGLKQIEPIGPGGEIIVDYAIHDAILAGFGKIVFVIRAELEKEFKAIIEPRWQGRVTLDYVFQDIDDLPDGLTPPANRKKPWGTGHAVYACRNKVHEPFGVINADDFYGQRSFKILADCITRLPTDKSRYCMAAFILRNTLSKHGTVARGICEVTEDGLLKHVVERTRIEPQGTAARCKVGETWINLTGNEIVSLNTWGFTPSIFKHLAREFTAFLAKDTENAEKEFQLPAVVDAVIRNGLGSVEVLKSEERWMGVTYPSDRQTIAEGIRTLIERGIYPPRLGNG